MGSFKNTGGGSSRVADSSNLLVPAAGLASSEPPLSSPGGGGATPALQRTATKEGSRVGFAVSPQGAYDGTDSGGRRSGREQELRQRRCPSLPPLRLLQQRCAVMSTWT